MRFVFVHSDIQGPFSLDDLYAGTTKLAGSVARFRVLFWLAALGHEVLLAGNVAAGHFKGVTARSGEEWIGPAAKHWRAGETVAVLATASSVVFSDTARELKQAGLFVIFWPCNPFSLTCLEHLAKGEIDRVVCVSRSHRDVYRRYPGFERLEVIYMGVDEDLIGAAQQSSRKSDNIVVSISIPRRTKGFHNILRAWRSAYKALPDTRLYVYGSAAMHDPKAPMGQTGILDVDLEREFSDFFHDPPRSNRELGVELLGPRTLPEVYAGLGSAAVALVNCNWDGAVETYCRSAVEAQVAGTPVIGAARGSLPEVVADGQTGILVQSPDPVALGKAVIGLLRDGSTRERMRRTAPGWARRFASYELISKEWVEVVERTRSGAAAPSQTRQPDDVLRRLGYGRARLWLRKQAKRLTPNVSI